MKSNVRDLMIKLRRYQLGINCNININSFGVVKKPTLSHSSIFLCHFQSSETETKSSILSASMATVFAPNHTSTREDVEALYKAFKGIIHHI